MKLPNRSNQTTWLKNDLAATTGGFKAILFNDTKVDGLLLQEIQK